MTTAVVSPTAGTRITPIDGLVFNRGQTAVFKMTFLNNGMPTKVDTGTVPEAKILQPRLLAESDIPVPNVIATLEGSLVPGQEFEYEFEWNIPTNITPTDQWIVSYQGYVGGVLLTFGDEMFTITATPGQVGIRSPAYATVDDVRKKKFNIDSYLPETASTLEQRNNLIYDHLRDATTKIREELALFQQRGMTENYRLFVIYYTVWSILLAARGEDGSSISDQNLQFWKNEWSAILAQEKRQGANFQGMSLGRG